MPIRRRVFYGHHLVTGETAEMVIKRAASMRPQLIAAEIRLWAPQVRATRAYFSVLERLQQGLDPHGILAPGNLGL